MESVCSLRLTQRGINGPLVVCLTNGKGFGVISLQNIPKGSFVCTYTGEEITEKTLTRQENNKLRKLAHNNDNDNDSDNNNEDDDSSNESDKSIDDKSLRSNNTFINYALQINDNGNDFNIDSE